MTADRLLSLSQAARLVGIRRSTLQQLVQDGRLRVFEGSIRESELRKEFPGAPLEKSGMVEKMRRIQDSALFKYHPAERPSAEKLAAEVHRLRVELDGAHAELVTYRRTVDELKDRLYDLQEGCDQRQAMMLGAIITWLVRRLSQPGA